MGIIGSSGTGKSTVLRIMAGLLAPDEGEVIIRGKTREGLLSDEKDPSLKVGMVFQSAALFDSLTVGENVGFKLYEHSDLPDDVIKGLIHGVFGAGGPEWRGGLVPSPAQRRHEEARSAMARRPIRLQTGRRGAAGDRLEEVVMYDEPTAGSGSRSVHGRGGSDAESAHAHEGTNGKANAKAACRVTSW